MVVPVGRPVADEWDWQLAAACRGLDTGVFFHSAGDSAQARRIRIASAKQVCQGCPVIDRCLVHALANREPYGVWGGKSEDERARMLGVKALPYPAARPVGAVRPRERPTS